MTGQTPRFIPQAESANRQKIILVVEDHPAIQGLLVDALTLAGYHCSCVVPEDIASLTWIENSMHMVPDGIVLDIDIRATMFRDPAEFLHACCARWQTVSIRTQMPPLLLLTTLPETQNECEREGYRVLRKPFKTRHLLEKMKTVMGVIGGESVHLERSQE